MRDSLMQRIRELYILIALYIQINRIFVKYWANASGTFVDIPAE